MIEIFLLGRFRVVRDGAEISATQIRGKLSRSLTAFLVTRKGVFVSRDQLAEALWPRDPPPDPTNRLKVLVSRARQTLGDTSLIVTEPLAMRTVSMANTV